MKLWLKLSKSEENLKTITKVTFQSLVFCLPEVDNTSLLHSKMLKIEFKFEYIKINKEMVTSFTQVIPVNVKLISRESPDQFQEKLRQLKLEQKSGFLASKMRNFIEIWWQDLRYLAHIKERRYVTEWTILYLSLMPSSILVTTSSTTSSQLSKLSICP